jgi:phosphomevalonate kinase
MSVASAPGKLFIVGEYAVLYGAPAIVLAVDVRARAEVTKIDGAVSILVDPITGEEFRFKAHRQNGLEWLGASPVEIGRIPQAVLATFFDEMPDFGPLPALSINMKTDAFYKRIGLESRKLGLGSSAAVLVALVGAFFDALSLPIDIPGISRFCYAAHRGFQGGQGSGVDIAAAIHGGALSNRMNKSDADLSNVGLVWPGRLFIVPVWSGESASTVELLSMFEAYRSQNPDSFGRHMRQLQDHAEQVFTAWLNQSVDDILVNLDGYQAALRKLDSEAGMGIVTDAHERLRRIAERHGAFYKTSGAGGGDFGFAFTKSREVAAAAREDFLNAGYFVLDNLKPATGLMVDKDL